MSVEGELVKTDPETVGEALARATQAVESTRWALTALRYELAVRTDWRTHFRAHPHLFLGAAFFLGFLFGNRGGSRRATIRPSGRR